MGPDAVAWHDETGRHPVEHSWTAQPGSGGWADLEEDNPVGHHKAEDDGQARSVDDEKQAERGTADKQNDEDPDPQLVQTSDPRSLRPHRAGRGIAGPWPSSPSDPSAVQLQSVRSLVQYRYRSLHLWHRLHLRYLKRLHHNARAWWIRVDVRVKRVEDSAGPCRLEDLGDIASSDGVGCEENKTRSEAGFVLDARPIGRFGWSG